MLGESNNTLIIIDADAIISFVAVNDVNHARAKTLMRQLAATNAYLLFPSTAICEAVTVLIRKLKRPEDAARLLEKFQNGEFHIQSVDDKIINLAASLFNPHGSNRNTLFDAVIAAIAKRYKANAIFSFDEWYKKQGFTLAVDFVGEEEKAA
jgi:predicted nucleic acid-binding protein